MLNIANARIKPLSTVLCVSFRFPCDILKWCDSVGVVLIIVGRGPPFAAAAVRHRPETTAMHCRRAAGGSLRLGIKDHRSDRPFGTGIANHADAILDRGPRRGTRVARCAGAVEQ